MQEPIGRTFALLLLLEQRDTHPHVFQRIAVAWRDGRIGSPALRALLLPFDEPEALLGPELRHVREALRASLPSQDSPQENTMSLVITQATITALQTEAAAAGDLDQVALCAQALEGDPAALERVAEALATARAMEEASAPDIVIYDGPRGSANDRWERVPAWTGERDSYFRAVADAVVTAWGAYDDAYGEAVHEVTVVVAIEDDSYELEISADGTFEAFAWRAGSRVRV